MDEELDDEVLAAIAEATGNIVSSHIEALDGEITLKELQEIIAATITTFKKTL